jgi:hypothetical protein
MTTKGRATLASAVLATQVGDSSVDQGQDLFLGPGDGSSKDGGVEFAVRDVCEFVSQRDRAAESRCDHASRGLLQHLPESQHAVRKRQ